MKARLKAIAANPYAYIIGFSLIGAACVVAGIGLSFGAGAAFVAAGLFMLGAASYIIKGLKPNG